MKELLGWSLDGALDPWSCFRAPGGGVEKSEAYRGGASITNSRLGDDKSSDNLNKLYSIGMI